MLWAGPAGLTGRGASTLAWREGGTGRGAETLRDHQPRRAPAANGTTGLFYLEDGSSWAGHGLFPALPTGYASLNGVRLQGRPHPREPGPSPERGLCSSRAGLGKLSGPAGETGTHFQQAGREGPRGPGTLLRSRTQLFSEGQNKRVPGFFLGRGSAGTSGSSICSYEKQRVEAVGHRLSKKLSHQSSRARPPQRPAPLTLESPRGASLGTPVQTLAVQARRPGNTRAHGFRSCRGAPAVLALGQVCGGAGRPQGQHMVHPPAGSPGHSGGTQVLGRKDIRRQVPTGH